MRYFHKNPVDVFTGVDIQSGEECRVIFLQKKKTMESGHLNCYPTDMFTIVSLPIAIIMQEHLAEVEILETIIKDISLGVKKKEIKKTDLFDTDNTVMPILDAIDYVQQNHFEEKHSYAMCFIKESSIKWMHETFPKVLASVKERLAFSDTRMSTYNNQIFLRDKYRFLSKGDLWPSYEEETPEQKELNNVLKCSKEENERFKELTWELDFIGLVMGFYAKMFMPTMIGTAMYPYLRPMTPLIDQQLKEIKNEHPEDSRFEESEDPDSW